MGFILQSFLAIAGFAITANDRLTELEYRNYIDGFTRECIETLSTSFIRHKGYFTQSGGQSESVPPLNIVSYDNMMACKILFEGIESQRYTFSISIDQVSESVSLPNKENRIGNINTELHGRLPIIRRIDYVFDDKNTVERILIRN